MKTRAKRLLFFTSLVTLVTIGVSKLYKKVRSRKMEYDPSIPPLREDLNDLGNLTKS